MTQFYNMIEDMYATPMLPQTYFLETMEGSFRKRQYRVGKNLNMVGTMQKKAAGASKCHGQNYGATELKKKKDMFCKGYNHVDLSDTTIKNIAIYYLNDIPHTDAKMLHLKKKLRYDVEDKSCPSHLFHAEDISIQQVDMDALGNTKDWVAVVKLNTEEDGYLLSELPYCKRRKYMIGSTVNVKVYVDEENCCLDAVDYKECDCTLKRLKDKGGKKYEKEVVVTGADYDINDMKLSRRRLLTQRHGGC